MVCLLHGNVRVHLDCTVSLDKVEEQPLLCASNHLAQLCASNYCSAAVRFQPLLRTGCIGQSYHSDTHSKPMAAATLPARQQTAPQRLRQR